MLFDPSNTTADRKAIHRKVTTWASEALPSVVRSAMARDPSHCTVSAREVLCTDPDCAPIDSCFVFVFGNGRRCVAATPGAFADLRRDAVYDAVLRQRGALAAAHGGRDPPRRARAPRRGGAPDDAWWYVSFGLVVSATATRVKHWRHPEDVVAAAAAAAGGSLLLYASGLLVASSARALLARRRARGGGSRATVAGKRAKFSDLGHRKLRGCPCCDPDQLFGSPDD